MDPYNENQPIQEVMSCVMRAGDIIASMTKEQQEVMFRLMRAAVQSKAGEPVGKIHPAEDGERTARDIVDSMTEEQRTVMYVLVSMVAPSEAEG